jgi:hypothetical protein
VHGFFACVEGARVCRPSPATPEVIDGVDNDCNGVTDDAPPADVRPRALLLGPAAVWTDAKAAVDDISAALEQAGVPFDVQPPKTRWEALIPALRRYALLIVPGYLEAGATTPDLLSALESFATEGGVVVVMKPLVDLAKPDTGKLTGLTSSVRQPKTTSIRIDGEPAPALAAIDSPEERHLPLVLGAPIRPLDVWVFEPDPSANTTVLARAFDGETPLGAIATRRPVGRGAVYAWGYNLTDFDGVRCYINCFEPSADVQRLFLRDALREGAAGHVILKHTVPGPEDADLLLSHDVDAKDAIRPGPWGDPGALQMAAMEKRLGVRATYEVTTDYLTGEFRAETVRALCKEGMCPVGGHSVRHLTSFSRLPRGDCDEKSETYIAGTPATLCGEVKVNLDILAAITHERPRVWRSPYLLLNPALFDVLFQTGVVIDSGLGVGDLKSNLPVDTAHTGTLQRIFHHRPLYEIPVTCEDGLVLGEGETSSRIELQAATAPRFKDAWEYTLARNADNGSVTTFLVHPSGGHGMPDDNLAVKVATVEWLIGVARARGLAIDSLAHFGDFWRARALTKVDGQFNLDAGYSGNIHVGALPITDFTLELGDEIDTFVCAACGQAEVHGKRVTIRKTLPAGAVATFTATPRALAPHPNKPAADPPK